MSCSTTHERSGEPSMRFSAHSNRLYVEGGCASMADLVAFRTTAKGVLEGPIYHFDPVRMYPVDTVKVRAARAI